MPWCGSLTPESDRLLDELVVDKNSWALGGALAAGQTVEQFMKASAEKIAEELARAKSGIEQ